MNGFIQPQIQTGGGTNGKGEPIPSALSWGEKIECKYFVNTLNNRGRYEDGKFTQSAYVITVDDMDFKAKFVRLLDSRANVICEKEVQGYPEVLEDIQRVKITI